MDNIVKYLGGAGKWLGVLAGLVVLAFGWVRAGQVEYNLPVDRVDLAILNTYVLSDPTYLDEANAPGDFVAMRENQVRLVYDRDGRSDVDGNKWKYAVTYTVFFIGQNLAPVHNTLTIEHGTGIHDYAEADVYRPGAHTIRVQIDNIEITSATGWVPDDIRLELATVTERYQRMDVQAAPGAFAFDEPTTTLSWDYVPGAESYDLEWTWVDDANTGTVTDPFERAVRVNVSSQSYRPNLSYRKGEVHFRVRAVGRFINVPGEYHHRRYGVWSSEQVWVITDAKRWEPERNLSYTTTFAEDGKFKKVMTYVDGAGKTRQVLTHLNSDETTVVTETVFDHEGRGVITSIPIPIPTIDLHYKPLLNTVSSSNVYSKVAFDLDHSSPPSPMHTSSGAANYFSSNNSFASIHRDYIPDAGGYPFSQVEYMRDATGRVARQGGVGPDHQLGTGHEVKFFYGSSSATELHQMFGGNVGASCHYLKKMSIDPNGQVSFAWQDQEERVVATALAGDSPENLVELDDMPTATMTYDLQMNATKYPTGNVLNSVDFTILNEQLGKQYDFRWELIGVIELLNNCVCVECKYALDIEITAPDGQPVPLLGIAGSPTHFNNVYQLINGTLCPAYSHQGDIDFHIVAQQLGNYRVVKTLKVLEQDLAAIEDDFDHCPGFPDYQAFLDYYENLIDPTDCEQPCTTYAIPTYTYTPSKPSQILNVATGADQIAGCNGAFGLTTSSIIETECEAIHQQMVADISPGGWLHDAQAWPTLTSPALIESYLQSNHREYCHFVACTTDASSKLFDIQMASLPDYSLGTQYDFLPTTFSPDDLHDPWFDPAWNPSRQTLRNDFNDLLFGNNGAYYNGSTAAGLIEYFDPNPSNPNVEQVVKDTYTNQCSGAQNPTQCIDALRWRLTAGSYIAAKNDLIIDYTINNRQCPYYNDAHTIVQIPSLPPQSLTNTGAYNSGNLASNCNSNCAGSVDSWMAQLENSCPALTSNNAARDQLRAALLDFCLGNCQDGNPSALLTDAHVTNGELVAVQSILYNLQCSTALDDLSIPDPYTYDDGNGHVYEGPCTVWDPGMIAIMDAVNANWTQPGAASIPIASNPILEYSFPTGTSLDLGTTGITLQDGANTCTVVELRRASNGALVDFTHVKMMRHPIYEATDPQTGNGNFQFTKMEVVLDIPTAPYEEIFDAYLYSGCNPGFTATQGTCAYPVLNASGTAWDPAVYPQDPIADCIDDLYEQAAYQANVTYQGHLTAYLNDVLNQINTLCREQPYSETFTVTHLPKVYQYTLYYYDQAGSLVRTIPPEGVQLLDATTTAKWDHGIGSRATDMPAHRMPTTYAYNSLGQMRKSNTPDGGEKRMWYNGKDQVRLSQDARQIANGDYAYVKYDELGRSLESGECVGCSPTITQAVLDDRLFPERQNEVLRDITTTYYDTPYDPTFATENLRTRVAAATREDAEGDFVTTQVYDYDDHGNVRKARTYLVGFGNFELEYQYDLISGKVNRANYQKGKPDYFAHRYSYDGDNRLIKAETTRDNVFWDRDGRYFYYPHGPLARLEIGQDNVQGQDHYYSIHGWIKGVNMPQYRTVAHDPGLDGEITTSGNDDMWVARDAFAYHLGFYDGDYDPIGLSMGGSFGTLANVWNDLDPHLRGLSGQGKGLFNGNIALMVTDLPDHGHVGGNNFLNEGIANAYQYDQLNRLKQMRSHHYTVANGWVRTTNGTGYWDSDYSYDRNGNIETLNRRMPDLSTGNPVGAKWMDQMSYHYDPTVGGKMHNKLEFVTDVAPSGNYDTDIETESAGNYVYDAIGNLVSDASEYISAIDWDLHGKVRWVHRATNPNNLAELKFWYDGTGNRVHKQSIVPGAAGGPDVVRDEWYVRDPQGNEMAVYERQVEDGWLVTRLKEHPIYGADRLGLDLNGLEISRYAVEEGPKEPTGDPAGRHALVIGEVMYDSPRTGDDFPAGKEYNEGEYVVLVNKSGMDLDLSEYTLRVGGDSLVLGDSLAAGERVIVGFGTNVSDFARLVALPAELERNVVMQSSLPLPDRGGVVSVAHESGAAVDEFSFGSFYELSAENPYLADSLLDSLSRRSSLKSVQRDAYGGGVSVSGSVGEEGSVGDIDPGIDPEPTEKAVWGKYSLRRGRKVYEFKNHLGNVLAVVSDVKLGVDLQLVNFPLVDYYVADVVEMTDYEPFGMQLANRHYVSGDAYRFGFNGKEGDDEWSGAGNSYDFGARMYDSRLGRWLTMDPKAGSYPENSSYSLNNNSPIFFMDPDGESPVSGGDPWWNGVGGGPNSGSAAITVAAYATDIKGERRVIHVVRETLIFQRSQELSRNNAVANRKMEVVSLTFTAVIDDEGRFMAGGVEKLYHTHNIGMPINYSLVPAETSGGKDYYSREMLDLNGSMPEGFRNAVQSVMNTIHDEVPREWSFYGEKAVKSHKSYGAGIGFAGGLVTLGSVVLPTSDPYTKGVAVVTGIVGMAAGAYEYYSVESDPLSGAQYEYSTDHYEVNDVNQIYRPEIDCEQKIETIKD